MSQIHGHRGARAAWAWRWLAALCCATCAAALAPAGAVAACAQITSWSNGDASFFPAPRVTGIDRSNTPGPFYFLLDSTQDKQDQVTYFALTANPSLTKDKLFTNSVLVNLVSFASVADATAVFSRELDIFYRENGRWGYSRLVTGQGVLSYYWDEPGNKQIYSIVLYQHTIIRVTLKSSSATEDVQTTGLGELSARVVRARDLVDAKCGTKPENQAPSIYFDAPGQGSLATEFMALMAGGSIAIGAYDPDGRDDLDWASFRLYVAGADKTDAVIKVINKLASEGRVKADAPLGSPGQVTYSFALDRGRLMTDHNLLRIEFNGTWPIRLKICDRKGACGESSYSLYFGPFLRIVNTLDSRCSGSASRELMLIASWGNNGYATMAQFYLALGPSAAWSSWTGDYWTLALGRLPPFTQPQWFHSAFGLLPVFTTPAWLPSGTFQDGVQVSTPATYQRKPSGESPLPAGNFTLVSGAADVGPTVGEVSRIETLGTRLCSAP